jgi:hypothetical protein
MKYSKKWGNYFKKIRRHKLAHAGLGCAMRKKIGRYPFIVKIWIHPLIKNKTTTSKSHRENNKSKKRNNSANNGGYKIKK